ncbi:MAG TPA: hypothetical protein VF134_05890 [Candidatus Dormibacteraeota bacterium]
MTPRGRLLLAPALVAVLLIVLLAAAALYLPSFDEVAHCPTHERPAPPWGPVTAVVGMVAFLLGGLLSQTYQLFDSPPAPSGRHLPVLRDGLMWVPVAFLAVVFLLLLYETIGLYDSHLFWPITWHVRCIARDQPPATLAVTCLMSLLLGHWLWFRPFRTD